VTGVRCAELLSTCQSACRTLADFGILRSEICQMIPPPIPTSPSPDVPDMRGGCQVTADSRRVSGPITFWLPIMVGFWMLARVKNTQEK
jgi:hypothetical protein